MKNIPKEIALVMRSLKANGFNVHFVQTRLEGREIMLKMNRKMD